MNDRISAAETPKAAPLPDGDLLVQPSADPNLPEFDPLAEIIHSIGEAAEHEELDVNDPETLPFRLAAAKYFGRGAFDLAETVALAPALAGITRIGIHHYALEPGAAEAFHQTYGLHADLERLGDSIADFIDLAHQKYRDDEHPPGAAIDILRAADGDNDPATLVLSRAPDVEDELIELILSARDLANLAPLGTMLVAGPDIPMDQSDYEELPYAEAAGIDTSVLLCSPLVQIVHLVQSMSDDFFGTTGARLIAQATQNASERPQDAIHDQ